MKKCFSLLVLVSLFHVFGCASAPKPAPEKQASPVVDVSAYNEQLANHALDGFMYKSDKLADSKKWDKWAAKAAPVIKDVLGRIPEGYVLQVTGHADGSGPEEPEKGKPGNIKISEDRAKIVYNALKKAGINSPKIRYKGVGSSDLIRGLSSLDPAQRRVTFKVVPEK